MPAESSDGLADVAEPLAGLTAAARAGDLDDTAALTALTAARRIAAELEHSELALIEAARAGGANWTRIAAALGASNRQTAQKRHADLARGCPRPPSVDMPAAQPGPQAPDARHASGSLSDEKVLVSEGALPMSTRRPPHGSPGASGHARPPAPARSAAARRRSAVPRITDAIIAEGRYELVRAPDHAETRAWHVFDGRLAGIVRPTWRGERTRPGWEPVDLSGLALSVKGTGRITSAGNARTRDAAAVSLLRALQCQQEQERKKATRDPASARSPVRSLSRLLRQRAGGPRLASARVDVGSQRWGVEGTAVRSWRVSNCELSGRVART
jgi:hypothetical protein